jgi:L-alanine-DL-glutamate epimerase-like enolase superfamily enzyme
MAWRPAHLYFRRWGIDNGGRSDDTKREGGTTMATITRTEAWLVDLQPKVKRTDAIQAFTSQETPFVRVIDADGAEGVGYSYTIGTGGSSVMALLVDHLLPQLIGRDADEIERIWRDLKFQVHALQPGAVTALALCAIDTALWDLRGRRTGLPLHRLAGGAKPSIPVYSTEGGWLHVEPEALVEDAMAVRERGFSGCKVKVGRPHVSEDVARLEAVRSAMGPGFEIFTDANQAFSPDEAIRRARAMEPLDVGWFEEPLPSDDVMGHIRLCQSTSLPIAVGESIYTIRHFGEYMARGACSVVQVDVARIGGITPWLKVAHAAETMNLPVCPHFLMELHVSLCCAVPNSRWLEYIPQLDDLTTEGMRLENGHGYPADTPGLGIAWDMPRIDSVTVEGSRRAIS